MDGLAPTLLITEDDVRVLAARRGSTAEVIDAMEAALAAQGRGEIELVSRLHVESPSGGGGERGGRSLRVLPCIAPALGGAAVRIYTMQKEGDPFRPAPSELILLYDGESMALRAVIEDYSLHALRTAAPTAVATRHLALPEAGLVGVVGTGRQARGQLAAVASVRPVRQVRAYGRNRERLEAFCAETERALSCPVLPCGDAEEAIRGAEIVVAATNTSEPVVRGAWLAPGVHVNSIAPWELDEEALRRARLFPCSRHEVLHGTPHWHPVPELNESGALPPQALDVELGHVVAGLAPGRRDPEEITVFLSTGMAYWDLVVAAWADRSARLLGLGRKLWAGGDGRTGTGFVPPAPSLPA